MKEADEIRIQADAAAQSGAAPAAKKGARVSNKKGNRMYLGPTITGVIRHAVVFKDGTLPQKAQECVKEFPIMERLFVDLDKMPETVRELNKKQSTLKTVYEQVEAYFGKRDMRRA